VFKESREGTTLMFTNIIFKSIAKLMLFTIFFIFILYRLTYLPNILLRTHCNRVALCKKITRFLFSLVQKMLNFFILEEKKLEVLFDVWCVLLYYSCLHWLCSSIPCFLHRIATLYTLSLKWEENIWYTLSNVVQRFFWLWFLRILVSGPSLLLVIWVR